MPEVNALQLFYRIKAISPATKVIFCSALDIEEELVSILPNITHDHIMKKPMGKEYFINRIKSLLSNSNMRYDILSHDR